MSLRLLQTGKVVYCFTIALNRAAIILFDAKCKGLEQVLRAFISCIVTLAIILLRLPQPWSAQRSSRAHPP